jgi:hypothetical protein
MQKERELDGFGHVVFLSLDDGRTAFGRTGWSLERRCPQPCPTRLMTAFDRTLCAQFRSHRFSPSFYLLCRRAA